MARHLNARSIIERTDNVIYDGEGREIRRIGTTETTVTDAHGRVEILKEYDTITMADGTSVTVSSLWGDKQVHIGCCALCSDPPFRFPFREKPSAGLVRLTRAKTCPPPCGKLLCPRHMALCSDGAWRCTRCARRHAFKTFIRRIFFERY